jgi:hypothetical protein
VHHVGERTGPDPPHQIHSMRLGCFQRDLQPGRDFLGPQSFAEKSQNLDFTRL